MKRLYVDKEARGLGVGHKLVDAIVQVAKEKHYSVMKLDTLQRLSSIINVFMLYQMSCDVFSPVVRKAHFSFCCLGALALYRQHGFAETTPHYHNPIPDVVFMEMQL